MTQPTIPCHSNPYTDASSPWPPPSHLSTGHLIRANAAGTQTCCCYLDISLHNDSASPLVPKTFFVPNMFVVLMTMPLHAVQRSLSEAVRVCITVSADTHPHVWLHRVTNPHEFEVDGISFLGTSGQNLDDIYKYSVEENRLTLLQRVLEWGHLVPTAPDTLTCYPLSDSDPFILQSAPHVFFVGNQLAYSSQMVTGRRFWNV